MGWKDGCAYGIIALSLLYRSEGVCVKRKKGKRNVSGAGVRMYPARD